VSIGLFPVILYDYHRLHKCKREKMEKKAEWMEGRGRKLWKTNDHNPIGYNDGLGVIKALSLVVVVVVYVRVIH
jgi:hypothetical protein